MNEKHKTEHGLKISILKLKQISYKLKIRKDKKYL